MTSKSLSKNSEKGAWYNKPLSEQRREFAKWLEAGNRPDDHPLVRSAEIGPPEGVTPETVAEVELKASYDRQDWFHCNDCGTKLKFKDRGQVMSFGDGYLYLIGPDCGNDLQKEMKRLGRTNFRRQMEFDAAFARLIEFKPKATEWQSKLQLIGAIGREVLAAQRSVTSVKRLHEALLQCRKDQGVLLYKSVEERPDNDPEKKWEKYKTIIKTFPKRINGISLFELSLPVLASMKELQGLLNKLDIRSATSPSWIEKMQKDLSGTIAINRAVLLNQLPSTFEQCSDQIRSVQTFFAPNNLSALNEWIRLDKSFRAEVRVEGSSFYLFAPELHDGPIVVDIQNLLRWK